METLPRDSAPETTVEAKDRRLPLLSVTFAHPVPLEGYSGMYTAIIPGEVRVDGGQDKQFKQVWLDPVLRTIVYEGRHYPMERVVCFTRSKSVVKMPPKPKLPDYVIGKRK